jgi:hypothetical protein
MDEHDAEFEVSDAEEEQLDFNEMKPCPHCKQPIPANATLCLYCGRSVDASGIRLNWKFFTAILLLVMGAIGLLAAFMTLS